MCLWKLLRDYCRKQQVWRKGTPENLDHFFESIKPIELVLQRTFLKGHRKDRPLELHFHKLKRKRRNFHVCHSACRCVPNDSFLITSSRIYRGTRSSVPLFRKSLCVLADFPVLHIRTLRMFQYQLLNWLPFIGREGEGGGIVSHQSYVTYQTSPGS